MDKEILVKRSLIMIKGYIVLIPFPFTDLSYSKKAIPFKVFS